MTLTHTVSSLAHDAASAASDLASDLGSQAAELGSKAAELGSKAGSRVAELGSDTKSSVASAATTLAHAIAQKVPGVHPKRKAKPWRLIVAVGLGVAGVFLFLKSRRKSANTPVTNQFTAPVTKQPAAKAKDMSTTNGTQAAGADQAAKH